MLKTVKQVSKFTGVSVRTLHYYDEIGLLKPTTTTESKYRLYDDTALKKLGYIMLFKELDFSLQDIKHILMSKNFNYQMALDQQIDLLKLKKERLDRLINFAQKLKENGDNIMNFNVFNQEAIDNYTKEAKAKWGDTKAFTEFENKHKNLSNTQKQHIYSEFNNLFKTIGTLKNEDPASDIAQTKVAELQDFISANFYTCTNQILAGLGKMYVNAPDFKANIDANGGEGTAEFIAKAIEIYCK